MSRTFCRLGKGAHRCGSSSCPTSASPAVCSLETRRIIRGPTVALVLASWVWHRPVHTHSRRPPQALRSRICSSRTPNSCLCPVRGLRHCPLSTSLQPDCSAPPSRAKPPPAPTCPLSPHPRHGQLWLACPQSHLPPPLHLDKSHVTLRLMSCPLPAGPQPSLRPPSSALL